MEVLLIGAVGMIGAALALAWLATFARWFVIKGVDGGLIKNYETLTKGHVDFILMSLFCLAFYSTRIPLPVAACWLIVVGGFTNPGVFVIAMFKPDVWKHLWMRIYTGLSFLITTVGFSWAGWTILQAI
jgi:hypothetical protein